MSTSGESMLEAPSTARSDMMRALAAVAFAGGRYLVALANIARETGGDDPMQARLRGVAQAETAVVAAGLGLIYFIVSIALRGREGGVDRRRHMIFSLIAGGLQYLVQWAIDPLVRELSFPALMVQQSLVVALLALVAIIISRRPVTGQLSPSHSSTP
jgi:hypothetical protein